MADKRREGRAHFTGTRAAKSVPRQNEQERAALRVVRDLEAVARQQPELATALRPHIIDATRQYNEAREQRRVRQHATPVTARSGTFEGITFASRADLQQTRRDERRAQELWRAGRVKEAKAIGRTLLRKMHLLTGDRDNWAWLVGEWQGS